MNFTDNEKILLSGIVQSNPNSITLAVTAAYEAGLAKGVENAGVAFKALLAALPQSPIAPTAPSGDDDEDDDGPASVTAVDAAWLLAQGINPDKKFRIKNSLFTITAVRRSRWKFPISGINQNGTRYKFSISNVKASQAR